MTDWYLVASILLPNVGGWLSTLTMIGQVSRPDGKAWYQTLKKPTWTPPNWLFGFVWIVLYSFMGYASYLVYIDCGGLSEAGLIPLSLYGGQLILNFMWTPVFFLLHKIQLAYYHLLALDAAVLACTISFYQVNTTAAYLMPPYLGWLCFATCLTRTIWKMNDNSQYEKTPLV